MEKFWSGALLQHGRTAADIDVGESHARRGHPTRTMYYLQLVLMWSELS